MEAWVQQTFQSYTGCDFRPAISNIQPVYSEIIDCSSFIASDVTKASVTEYLTSNFTLNNFNIKLVCNTLMLVLTFIRLLNLFFFY